MLSTTRTSLISMGEEDPTLVEQSNSEISAADEDNKPEEVTSLAPQVVQQATLNGACQWNNLQLAPPPPMYRPFVIMREEELSKKKSKLSKDKIEGPDDNEADYNIDYDESDDKFKTDKQVTNAQSAHSSPALAASVSKHETPSLSLNDKKISQLPSSNALEKEAWPEEKIAREGEYVIIVQEVTNPPFLGRKLQPAYLLLQIRKEKKVIPTSKKPSVASAIVVKELVEADKNSIARTVPGSLSSNYSQESPVPQYNYKRK
ncbi:uncharacterized protein LOC131931621 [Physella acuta]|uniref:uncharacterized protein LOC131931621 n=1 Tax=Physella acuta TaxID=109671 RepID=UPI0027DDAA09|nr:uncharacterized protein LOC131931621 [Physella acuta]